MKPTRTSGEALDAMATLPTPSSSPVLTVASDDLSQIRHRLRTPLTALIGYTEFLIEDVEALGHQSLLTDLGQILHSGRILLKLVTDLPLAAATDPSWEDVRRSSSVPISTIVGRAAVLRDDALHRAPQLVADLQKIETACREFELCILRLVDGKGLEDRHAASPASSAARAQDEGHVLVVDDLVANRDLLTRQLLKSGYRVTVAKSGGEALRKLKTETFDLVLLDVRMPDIDGIEVLRRVKTDPDHADVPVIMISALDEMTNIMRCIRLGAEDYLAKPWDTQTLRIRVSEVIARTRASGGPAADDSVEMEGLGEMLRRMARQVHDHAERSVAALSTTPGGTATSRA